MNPKLLSCALAASLAAIAATPALAITYADEFVSATNTTSFGSGVVTGAPDGGGRFLGDTFDPPANPGTLTVKFGAGLTTGAGADLFVVDVVSSAIETADVFVSADGVSFTFVGGLNAVANSLDIDALYSGVFSYVKLTNSSNIVSIDIDAVGGYYDAPPIPEPSTYALMGVGLLGVALAQRRRARATRAG